MYRALCGRTFYHFKSNYIPQAQVFKINDHVYKVTLRYYNYIDKTILKKASTLNKIGNPTIYMLQNKNEKSTEMECYSTSVESGSEPPKLSKKDKLKQAVKDYGSTVIIFHITISLMSLGISYLVISSGVDVASILQKVGVNSDGVLATEAGTFVVAYAVHKVFAPVRISITLGATPFIVRYLRRAGILKPPKTGP